MQLVLVMFRAEGERRSFSVTRDTTIIGRREDCDLRIPVSEVSRKHCRVIKDGDQIRVEDLGSSNGTYHNGQRIMGSVVVQPGDSIEVGPVVFVVQVDNVPPDDELAPFTDRAAHNLEVEAAPATEGDFGDLDGNSPVNESAQSGSFIAHAAEADLSLEQSRAGTGAAIPMADEEPALDIDLSNDHHAGGHALSEDELLMDLNTTEDREKH